MKRLIPIISYIILVCNFLSAQTDGISYQAVIIDPNGQELPGVDAEGNILPNAEISIRFTIIDANNQEEYQEIQTTHTDAYGMVNIIIGQGDPDAFSLVEWDGTRKDLKVEIDFGGSGAGFSELSRQTLTFVPYAYHRNIQAHGTLEVDDAAMLNSELIVDGPTNLNSSLSVNNNNQTTLTGPLSVGGESTLEDDLSVGGTSDFNDSVNVNNLAPTYLSGDLTVGADGTSTFNGSTVFNAPSEFLQIGVNGPSDLNGQVTVTTNLDSVGGQDAYTAYPLLVQGSSQGLAVKVNGNRSINNNYISFWDDEGGTPTMWGRIEGITLDELKTDPEYKWEHGFKKTDIVINTADFGVNIAEGFQSSVDFTAAITSITACAGLGACVTAPIPSFITSTTFEIILKIANIVVAAANLAESVTDEIKFIDFRNQNIGVSYQSGAGDYAEWLPKLNPAEEFSGGELVGVKNGFVTKSAWDAEKIMVVSTRPIVLGNMPQPGAEADYVKIAFMGQVPVEVIGDVQPGDYILPSEMGSGFGRAVHPDDIELHDYSKIAGVAWRVTGPIANGVNFVNVAVGINTNDLTGVIIRQKEELMALRGKYDNLLSRVERTDAVLASLVPGYAEAAGLNTQADSGTGVSRTVDQKSGISEKDIVYPDENDILYFKISREQVETAIDMAREAYVDMVRDSQQTKSLFFSGKDKSFKAYEDMILMPVEEHPFWQKMDSDTAYRKAIVDYVISNMEKAINIHKKYDHNFTNLELHE